MHPQEAKPARAGVIRPASIWPPTGGRYPGMMQWQKWFGMARLALVASIAAVVLAALALPADARGGGHGRGGFAMGRGLGGHGTSGAQFASGRRHGNDSYIKAASDDRDKLLTTQLKSICRGC